MDFSFWVEKVSLTWLYRNNTGFSFPTVGSPVSYKEPLGMF